MRITSALIAKLLSLRAGNQLPVSALRGEWVDRLLREGALVTTSHGSRSVIRAANPSMFEQTLASVDERLANLDDMAAALTDGDTSRADLAAVSGNSKLLAVRSCPGFMVNAYEPIQCTLRGEQCTVCPPEGVCLFISDWRQFIPPANAIIVGIENMENFLQIRRQRALFEREIGDRVPLLFVARYPQSTDLRQWLEQLPNRYVHFGDFDLAGVAIFLREFHRYLPARAKYLIPADIDQRLAHGSRERYQQQYERFHNLIAEGDAVLTDLIAVIHRYARAYDQEGYIRKPLA